MTQSISCLLEESGIHVPEYGDHESRLYQSTASLPSGREAVFVFDKSNDLCYQLARGIVDVAITGMDYVWNLKLSPRFSAARPDFPWRVEVEEIRLAHRRLKHLGFYGTQFAAMVRSTDVRYTSLDDFITNREQILCFTEFPSIAAVWLMETPSYRRKFGAQRPVLVSRGASLGENAALTIVRSEGSTESKAVARPGDLIIELVLSAQTAVLNDLQIIERFGEKIYTALFTRGSGEQVSSAQLEFVDCLESAVERRADRYHLEYLDPAGDVLWREAIC